ncbi:MAG: hypothetical protein IJ646_01680, partial [Clostridia bacterium]|nr:hypothetical protein [Clostridia bacterium]
SSSSSSSSSKSSATKAPSATPTPEPTEAPTEAPMIDFGPTEDLTPPTFGDPEPVELSPWYLADLEQAASTLGLTQFQHDVTGEWPNAWFNEVLLISGDATTQYFHITGEGYAVYGVSVGDDMDTAVETLTAAGLSKADSLIGASFQHYAGTDAPVNVKGFDSFINLIADASGKVSEISWSVYTGDWATESN